MNANIATSIGLVIALGAVAVLIAHFQITSAAASAAVGIIIGAAIALGAFSRALKGTNSN